MEAASAPLTLPAVPAVAGPGAKPVNDTSRSRSGKARPALTVPMQLDAHQGSAQRGRGYTRGHTDRVLMQGISVNPFQRREEFLCREKIQRREKMYRRLLQRSSVARRCTEDGSKRSSVAKPFSALSGSQGVSGRQEVPESQEAPWLQDVGNPARQSTRTSTAFNPKVGARTMSRTMSWRSD